MYIDYYGSYLTMIRNSVGSHTWKNLFIKKENWNIIDILQDGNVSCAYYVSSILKQFGYCWATYANVLSLEKHLIEYGRNKQKNFTEDTVTPWSVIIREEKKWSEKEDIYGNSIKNHYHIGFYIWSWRAISNMSDGFTIDDLNARTPQEHHITYNWSRPICSILQWNFTKTLQQHIMQTQYSSHINKQLEIPFIGQTLSYLTQYGFYWDELERALWSEEWLSLGRMCGWACIVMAYQYITWKKDKTLKDIVYYKDLTHKKWWYRNKEHWRYHDGLIAITTDRWLSGTRWNTDINDTKKFKELIADCIDNKKVLLLSVSPWFESNNKWWHLVVIRWYNRNGYDEELIINDPLDPKEKEGFSGAPISKKLSEVIQCWSGKYIIVTKNNSDYFSDWIW
jgi:hypothetical protein